MPLAGRAAVVGITRPPSTAEDGGVPKASDTSGDGRAGAVVVDVGPVQHQALQHAERKARTYGKALLGLASLLCLSVCGNLASSALSILVFKESRFRAAIPPSSLVVPSDSKAAAPVGTGLTSYAGTGLKGVIVTLPFEVPTYVKDTPADPEPPVVATAPADDTVPLVVSLPSVPGVKQCAVAPSGTEACWELADPAMTDIPDNFLQGNIDLTGTLKVGPAVKTIGAWAFAYTTLAGLDLSDATSLVDIGEEAFRGTYLESTLVIPAKVTTIGAYAFQATKLTSLDLSQATALASIEAGAFCDADLEGTLVVPGTVTTIGNSAFESTELTGLDLSKATSLVSIGEQSFYDSGLEGTLVIPGKVTSIGPSAFAAAFDNSKLTNLDLSKANSLVEIGNGAFFATNLKGTLVIPGTVTTIGTSAFQDSMLTGLDLSKATSLVEIGKWAFYATDLEGMLVIPATVTTIGSSAFTNTKLTGLDLSDAAALVSIGDSAFSSTDLGGTLVIPATVKRIGDGAFFNTETALDFSKATSLVEIKDDAFFGTTDLEGTLVPPATVTMIGSQAFADTKLTDLNLSEATPLSIGAKTHEAEEWLRESGIQSAS